MYKVLLVNNGYPTRSKPHYCTYIRTIEEGLKAAGVEVTLLVMNSDFRGFPEKAFRYATFYQFLLKGRTFSAPVLYFNHWPDIFLPLIPRLILPKGLFTRKSIIVNWHGGDLYTNRGIKSLWNRISYRFLQKDFIHVVPSEYLKNLLVEEAGVSLDKILIIPSGGVDTELFSPAPRPKDKTETVVFGYASGLTRAKGCFVLLEALKVLCESGNPKISLVCIDYGSDRKKFREKACKAGVDPLISWVAPMEKNEMPKFYRSLDLLLFPTLGESLGLTALEAMACGVPIIGTDAFAVPEYVEPGVTGDLFPEGSSAGLVDCILSVLKDVSSIQRMKDSCVKTIHSRYSRFVAIALLKKLLESLSPGKVGG